jgi:hypothetical protein
MRVLCAWFPKLDIDLATKLRPALGSRAVVLLQGHGDRALVSATSCEGSRGGILPGMSAGQARRRSPMAVFLADNGGACLDELERIARIVRARTTTRVEVGGRDHLFVAIHGEDAEHERELALRLMGIIKAWADRPVRGGLSDTKQEALEAARSSRRGLLVTPPRAATGDAGAIGPLEERSVAVRQEFAPPLPGLGARATIGALLSRAERVLDARGDGFRTVDVTIICDGGTFHASGASPQPLHTAAEAMALVAPQLPAESLDGTASIGIALGRLSPDIRVKPLGAANFEDGRLARAS